LIAVKKTGICSRMSFDKCGFIRFELACSPADEEFRMSLIEAYVTCGISLNNGINSVQALGEADWCE